MMATAFNGDMTSATLTHATADGVTERVDAIASLDERSRRRALEEPPREPGRYLEVQGAERALLLPIGAEPLHIGRGRTSDLHLDEIAVSRRHAILLTEESGARLLDESSSNGTFVNGTRVQQAQLKDGDVIEIGRVVLRYIEIAAAPPA